MPDEVRVDRELLGDGDAGDPGVAPERTRVAKAVAERPAAHLRPLIDRHARQSARGRVTTRGDGVVEQRAPHAERRLREEINPPVVRIVDGVVDETGRVGLEHEIAGRAEIQVAHALTKELRVRGEVQPQLLFIDAERHGRCQRAERDELPSSDLLALAFDSMQPRLAQRFDCDEHVRAAQYDERLTCGNLIDEDLEDRALVLRSGRARREQDQQRDERGEEATRLQRAHTPFGVCRRSCRDSDPN